MGSTAFAKFVEEQQTVDSEEAMDWNGELSDWRSNLDSFYARVLSFLKEFTDAGSITYSFSEIALTEENLGTYQVNKMNLHIGRQQVSLEPIGTLLMFCKGRVDVVGSAGRAQILLVNEKAKSPGDLIKVTVTISGPGKVPLPPPPQPKPQTISWAWKIVTQTPSRVFVDLDKDSFYSVLMEIANA
jgi:hypothetical protein